MSIALPSAIEETTELELQVASWMIKHRKGFFFVETNLLWQCLDFKILVEANGYLWKVEPLNFEQLMEIQSFIIEGNSILIHENNTFAIGNDTYQILKTGVAADPMSCSIYQIDVIYGASNLLTVPRELIFENKTLFIFPEFLKSNNFISRLEVFLAGDLPVTTTYQYYFEESRSLQVIINTFVNWHNCLIHQVDVTGIVEELKQASFEMATALLHLNRNSNELS